ncbi:hypothetical protein K402DRAFT_398292, partial [Aulographum hederae CBS 113979]
MEQGRSSSEEPAGARRSTRTGSASKDLTISNPFARRKQPRYLNRQRKRQETSYTPYQKPFEASQPHLTSHALHLT